MRMPDDPGTPATGSWEHPQEMGPLQAGHVGRALHSTVVPPGDTPIFLLSVTLC